MEEILQKICEHYGPMNESAKSDFKSVARYVEWSNETTLVEEGSLSDELYFIQKGCIRAYYLKDGKDITDWFAFENDFVCAINSFFLDVPSPHFVETLEDTVGIVMKRDAIENLCLKHHDIERIGRISATKTMLHLQERIVGLQFETARNKYDILVQKTPDITQRVPLGMIASFLGITQETLSRIRSEK